MKALLGSGYYSTLENHRSNDEFRQLWLTNLGERDIVVINNAELLMTWPHYVRNIKLSKNLGHVGGFIGQYRPQLLGWSMSWLIPAEIAYCEGRDFCYVEQDALCFGDWEQSILTDMENKNLLMAYGTGSALACCEQSLFYIKHEFINEAIWMYRSIPEGDGLTLPEDKFRIMSERNMRVGTFSMGCGRRRPLPLGEKTWFSQKFSAEELAQLKERGLI